MACEKSFLYPKRVFVQLPLRFVVRCTEVYIHLKESAEAGSLSHGMSEPCENQGQTPLFWSKIP